MATRDRVHRINWLDRQALEAKDLSDQAHRETFTRRLHVSGVHNTWGIALGLWAVRRSNIITVLPGLAYDRLGREIVSATPIEMPDPNPSSDGLPHWFDLVARWAGLDQLAAGRELSDTCASAAVLEERPLLRWVDAGRVRVDSQGNLLRLVGYGSGVRLGIDIPLGRIPFGSSGPLDELDLSTRRAARGLVRPHIATGTIRQGTVDLDPFRDHRWWSMLIHTAAGGLTTSSTTYLAALGAHPWGESSAFNSGVVDAEGESPRNMLAELLHYGHGPFLDISEQDRTSFRLTVRHALPPKVTRASITVPTNPVPVHWIGIEWVGGCEPVSSPFVSVLLNSLASISGGTGFAVRSGDPT